MIGNMAEIGLQWNGGQGLQVGLVGMLVTKFIFQKSHDIAYFFRVDFYCSVECLKFLVALEAWGTM